MRCHKYTLTLIVGAAGIMFGLGYLLSTALPAALANVISMALGLALGMLAVIAGHELDDRAWHRRMHKEFDDELG